MNDADALLAALKAYRCQHTLDQDGGGIDLVDVLSPGDTIAPGLLELELLAEHLEAAVGEANDNISGMKRSSMLL